MAGGRFSGQGQHIEDLGKFFCNSLGCDIFHVKYVNVNSRANLPLHEVRVHFDRAGSQKVSVPVWLELDFCAFRLRRLAQSQGTLSGPRYFPVNFRANVPSCDVHLHSECLWHCLAGVQTSWSACRGCARSNRPATGDSSLMPLLLASWLIWLPTNPHNRAVGTLASRCWSYCLSRL